MQQVERHNLALALARVADEFEGCGLCIAVHRHQVLLIVHTDAVAGRDLDQRAREIGHAEDRRRVGEEIELAVLQNAAAAQAVGDQIDDLLRRTRTFERHRRLRAHHLVAGLELLHAVPSVARRLGRIVAAHPVASQRLAQARDLVPVELHAGADHQVIVSQRVAVPQVHRIAFRLEGLRRVADPCDARRHHARFRTMGFRQRINAGSD